jgi:hypothetical protein
LWEFNWQTPSQPGKQTLIARATDSLGRTQPSHRDPDRGTYMINHLLPIEVEVSSGERARLACWRARPRDRELFSPWQI